jgi:anti-sigma regulatory factor (Ser/Thr protein kinase)
MTDVTATLPRASASVAVARRIVEGHTPRLTDARREDAGLMASELVTNALRHGQGTVTLRIVDDGDALTVEVCDEGHGTVAIADDAGGSGGWGLRIVEQLADGWGATMGSTRVWFRLRHDRD